MGILVPFAVLWIAIVVADDVSNNVEKDSNCDDVSIATVLLTGTVRMDIVVVCVAMLHKGAEYSPSKK